MENALVCVNNNGILNTVADIFKFPKPGTNLFNIVMNYCTIEHLSCLTVLENSGVLGWNFKLLLSHVVNSQYFPDRHLQKCLTL